MAVNNHNVSFLHFYAHAAMCGEVWEVDATVVQSIVRNLQSALDTHRQEDNCASRSTFGSGVENYDPVPISGSESSGQLLVDNDDFNRNILRPRMANVSGKGGSGLCDQSYGCTDATGVRVWNSNDLQLTGTSTVPLRMYIIIFTTSTVRYKIIYNKNATPPNTEHFALTDGDGSNNGYSLHSSKQPTPDHVLQGQLSQHENLVLRSANKDINHLQETMFDMPVSQQRISIPPSKYCKTSNRLSKMSRQSVSEKSFSMINEEMDDFNTVTTNASQHKDARHVTMSSTSHQRKSSANNNTGTMNASKHKGAITRHVSVSSTSHQLKKSSAISVELDEFKTGTKDTLASTINTSQHKDAKITRHVSAVSSSNLQKKSSAVHSRPIQSATTTNVQASFTDMTTGQMTSSIGQGGISMTSSKGEVSMVTSKRGTLMKSGEGGVTLATGHAVSVDMLGAQQSHVILECLNELNDVRSLAQGFLVS